MGIRKGPYSSMISVAAIVALFFSWSPFSAMAADVTLVPSLQIRGEYDDNVGFQAIEEKHDYFTTISPSFLLTYDTELLNLDSSVVADFVRYRDETDLNTERQRYELNGSYRIVERLQIKGGCSYVKDTTLESELEETGLVFVRTDRERYNMGGGLLYQITEISDIGADYTHRKTEYDWPGYVDYDSDAISLSFNHRFRNGLDIFTLQPYYTSTDSKTSEVDTYAVLAGWSHRFTETLDLTLSLGPRYTTIDYAQIKSEVVFDPELCPPFQVIYKEVKEHETEWGYIVDCAVRNLGETYSASVGYSRDLTNSSFGEPIERDRLYCTAQRRISQRFRVLVSGGLSFSESEGKFTSEDQRHFYVAPALSYSISEDHSVQFAYRYAHVYDKMLAHNPRYDRNRIWITLTLRFPEKDW
jgi:hypothetical protein